eukprot:1387750-Amorphochlora_amoeboformis.AAC.1
MLSFHVAVCLLLGAPLGTEGVPRGIRRFKSADMGVPIRIRGSEGGLAKSIRGLNKVKGLFASLVHVGDHVVKGIGKTIFDMFIEGGG